MIINDLAIVTVNDGTSEMLDLWEKCAQKHFPSAKIIIEQPNTSLPRGSRQHGEGLNRIIQKLHTEYVLILDSDCMLLESSWFNPPFYVLAARKAGHQTMHVCFLAGLTQVFNKCDFRAQGIQEAYQPSTDVGSNLGLLNESLELIDCKSGRGQLFGADMQSDEIWFNGKLIAAHFGRGSNLNGKIVKDGRATTSEQYKKWMSTIKRINKGYINEKML